MRLREALAAATDSAGRIHSTRALALAIDEADALLSLAAAYEPPVGLPDDLLYGTRTALCRVLDLSVSVPGREIVDRVQDLANSRDEERARTNEWLTQKHDAERERDEARAEVERLRAALEVERSLECDASAVIREAEERGARWAIAHFFPPPWTSKSTAAENAARICREARERGEHE
jgi:hypothetical protein